MVVEDLIDELLQEDAARDIIAQEIVTLVDAMARDLLWKGNDSLMEDVSSIFPKPLPSPPEPTSNTISLQDIRVSRS